MVFLLFTLGRYRNREKPPTPTTFYSIPMGRLCFRIFYRRHRARGKGANEAITITARRIAKIAWKMLTEQRNYAKVPTAIKSLSPAALDTD